jgi:hypothetical protein
LDLKWREMQMKMNFRHPKWLLAPIWNGCQNESCVLIWNGGKCKKNRWVSGPLVLLFFTKNDTFAYSSPWWLQNFHSFHIEWACCLVFKKNKPGVQVSIGHCIIDNENRVTGRSKIPQECRMGIFGRQGGTYVVVWRPSNLIYYFLHLISSIYIYEKYCYKSNNSLLTVNQ